MSKYKLHIDKEELWKGYILKSIADAIFVAHAPDFAHESSWDGCNYSMQDSQGEQGTITFHPDYTIVCLQDVNSERIDEWIDAANYFEEAPSEVLEIAKEEALQYVLEEEYAKLSVALPYTECEFFKPYVYMNDAIEGKNIMVIVRRRPLLNSKTDTVKIQKYEEEFKKLQEEYKALVEGTM